MPVAATSPFRWSLMLCAALAILVLGGCGASGPEKAAIFGKVTLDGAPVEKGSISFIPTGAAQGPSAGALIEDGEYRTLDGKGPTLGLHRVEITAHRAGKSVSVPSAAGATSGPSAGGTVEVIEMYIPEKYNTKSELTLDVQGGQNEKDFQLTSK